VDQADAVRFRLSKHDLAQLAEGGGDPNVVSFLTNTEYNRRLLLLLEVCKADRLDGPLPPLDDAWAALARARVADPIAFQRLVMHPQVGSWAAYATRQHRGRVAHTIPSWNALGQLHALAVVAAQRVGFDWRTRVPLMDGRVTLPGLGQAWFARAHRWDVADAEAAQGRIRLRHSGEEVVVPANPGDDDHGWWGLRRITVEGPPTLSIILDDIDPFRDLADPVAPERLGPEALEDWQSLLTSAWEILRRRHVEVADPIAVGVRSLAPLPLGGGWGTRSASSGEAFGAVLLSPPPDATTLAVSLIHEFQHIKLGGLLHLCRLCTDDVDSAVYAPWRDDPRPVSGLLQGVYAFFGITEFWRREWLAARDDRFAQFEYAHSRGQTMEGFRSLAGASGLTRLGRDMVDELAAAAAAWDDAELDPEIVRLAALAVASHRTEWRIHHLRVDPAEVDDLVGKWRTGGPAEVDPDAATQPATGPPEWLPGRLPLLRAAAVGQPFEPVMESDYRNGVITPADQALAQGLISEAQSGFVAQIVADPERAEPWAGLALTFGPDGDGGGVLHRRPGLVRAVYLALWKDGQAPEPAELVTWLDRGLSR
jgi:HEXXH motif-containing protein